MQMSQHHAQVIARVVVVGIERRGFFQMFPRGCEVPSLALQNTVQIEKVRVMRGQRQKLNSQRRSYIVLSVQHQNPEIDALRLNVFRVPGLTKVSASFEAS